MKAGHLDIDYDEWRSTRFILAINFERGRMGNGIEAANTGLSSQGAENIVLNFRGIKGAGEVTHAYITLVFSNFLSIRADGVALKL